MTRYMSHYPITNPAHMVAKRSARYIRANAKKYFKGRLLDIGCGSKRKLDLVGDLVEEYIGFDHAGTKHDTSKVDIFGTAWDIPVPDNSFDLATIAFGIRNVSDIPATLSEVIRTLKDGGRFVILEFSMPRSAIVLWAYRIYLRHILPRIGGALSGDESAYRYLNQSAEAFPSPEKFAGIISQAGFDSVSFKPLTLGLVTIYVADKSA